MYANELVSLSKDEKDGHDDDSDDDESVWIISALALVPKQKKDGRGVHYSRRVEKVASERSLPNIKSY